MKFIVGGVALVSGGKIFASGEEISESDFLDSTTFENAKNKNLIVATETSNVKSDVENTTETSKKSGKKKE